MVKDGIMAYFMVLSLYLRNPFEALTQLHYIRASSSHDVYDGRVSSLRFTFAPFLPPDCPFLIEMSRCPENFFFGTPKMSRMSKFIHKDKLCERVIRTCSRLGYKLR